MAATLTKPMPRNTLSQTPIGEEELAQRVAIVKRFRELLIKQRDRFRNYLVTLEQQESVIENGNTDELIAHVELEEQIVADIFAIQKVIDPLDEMYRAMIPVSAAADDVPALKATLENLKTEAIARFEYNRDLLSTRMTEIRAEIKQLRNNPFTNRSRSMYQEAVTAALVDISG